MFRNQSRSSDDKPSPSRCSWVFKKRNANMLWLERELKMDGIRFSTLTWPVPCLSPRHLPISITAGTTEKRGKGNQKKSLTFIFHVEQRTRKGTFWYCPLQNKTKLDSFQLRDAIIQIPSISAKQFLSHKHKNFLYNRSSSSLQPQHLALCCSEFPLAQN